jgi:hypothetical protein
MAYVHTFGKQQVRKKRRTGNGRKGLVAAISRHWRKGGLGTRSAMTFIGIITVICVMALVMGLTRLIQWHIEVTDAQRRQEQLSRQYDFNPGQIISDAQFFNADAMNAAEVQAFLNKQNPSCTASNCLKNMTFNTTTIPAGDLCSGAYQGAKGEQAGTVITKSAKACGISEKVLLTILQKEQHLVSATNPSDFQYKSAMGLSCPDDADCDPQYAGFFRQVYGSAKRFKYYQANGGQYGYHAGTLNYVQYHPNKACGGSQVYINNQATALLYIYTPYQPNTAALQAEGGEGDACSSYGNRNFAMIYNNWFGDPRR